MLGCNNIGHHPLLAYAGPDPHFLLSAQSHGPHYGPDIKFPLCKFHFYTLLSISIREEESEIPVLGRSTCWTSEYAEWIEGRMIRVAQTRNESPQYHGCVQVLGRWSFTKTDANDVDKSSSFSKTTPPWLYFSFSYQRPPQSRP